MTSVAQTPFTKWNLECFIYTDPALNSTERFVAIQVLKTLDNKFRPVKAGLMSQALIGWRVRRWRETVCRALGKLRFLGYFRTSWVTVDRPTAQGIKGVTRVMCELGPVLRKLVEKNASPGMVSAAQAHGVTVSHPSPTPPGRPGTVGSSVTAKSADRNGGALSDSPEFKRKTLDQWPRLAGSRPPGPTGGQSRLPAAALLRDRAAYHAYLAELNDGLSVVDDDEVDPVVAAQEAEARLAEAQRRRAAWTRDEIARADRNQPRRKPPRSHR